jgi:hypothetical protein
VVALEGSSIAITEPSDTCRLRTMRWKLDEVTRARGRWRDATRVVAMRWDNFLGCEAPLRPLAYTSYLAALDAEEAAAAEVAKFTRRPE